MAIILEEGYTTVGLLILLAIIATLVVFIFIPWFLKTSFGQTIAGAYFPGGTG